VATTRDNSEPNDGCLSSRGRVRAISVSKEKGTQKTNIPEAELRAGFGIIGDAHAGNWHRQISLLGAESIDKLIEKGVAVGPGGFAENITTEGIDLSALQVGTKLNIGQSARLEITQIGKNCHSQCEIFVRFGDCIMPRQGVFAKVTRSGRLIVGDIVEVVARHQV